MIYNQLPPDPQLRDFVRCYWWLDNTTAEKINFNILPDGCFDLILRYENYQLKGIALSGLWSKDVDVQIQPNTQLIGVQFRLLAVDAIFDKSIALFFNSGKKLRLDYWELNEISFQAPLLFVDQMNQHLLSITSSVKKLDPRKQQLFSLLYQTKGNQTVEYYAQKVFWSSRQINRYFKQRFGLSLKTYCNILKCAASFKQLKNGELFPAQNYFDQSHFIKTLKKYTRTTPTDLFENKNDRFLQLAILPKK